VLGIPSFEEKVAQLAIVMPLEPISEQDFRDSSFGIRAGRNAHQALRVIRHGKLVFIETALARLRVDGWCGDPQAASWRCAIGTRRI
jgi:hypothetical protein